MGKALSIVGLAVAALLILLFALDLAIGVPFRGASPLMDIGFLICGGLLAFLSWTTFREQG